MCKVDNDSCLSDSECCGGDCHKPPGNPTGNCRQQPGNPSGNTNAGGAGKCVALGAACSKGADCCSGNCTSGKCVAATAATGSDPMTQLTDWITKNPLPAVGIAAFGGILLSRMR